MTKRIFAGIISVSLLTMIACIVLLMGVMYDYMGEKIDEEMKNEARLVEAALDGSGADYLEAVSYTHLDVYQRQAESKARHRVGLKKKVSFLFAT